MHQLTLTTLQLLIMIDALRTLKYHYISLLNSNKFTSDEDIADIKNNLKEVEKEIERLDVIYVNI